MTPVKRQIDWERVEVDYRAGLLSLREIAAQHSMAESAIRKRAKRDEWSRDLNAKITAKAEALVRKELVRSAVRTETITEREVVEASANAVATVCITQRKDIGRNREMVSKLFEELEAVTDNKELFSNIAEILSGSEEVSESMMAAFRKAMSLPGRADTMFKLANTQKVLIGLEREAYNIGEKGTSTGKVSLLEALNDD